VSNENRYSSEVNMFKKLIVNGSLLIVNGNNFQMTITEGYQEETADFIVETLNNELAKRKAELCQTCATMISVSADKCLVCGTKHNRGTP
jgi:hypothetical protein